MKKEKIEIVPGCISCGTCEFICPEAFVVQDIAHVREDVNFKLHEKAIDQAADMCPVSVIKVTREQ